MANAATVRRIERLRAKGLTNREIGAIVGLSRTHVARLMNPRSMESTLSASRTAKRRRTGTCTECGGVTRYNATRGRPTISTICSSCQHEKERAAKYWTRDRIIRAIRAWAKKYGQPPTATEWRRAGTDPRHPAKSSVYVNPGAPNAPFANWADAIEAAGFPRPYRGHKFYKSVVK